MKPVLLARSIAMGVLLLAVASCGFFAKTRSWTEDVQLDDGSVIVIERYVKFETSNSWAGDAPGALDRRATLRFTEALSDLPTWDVALTPMVLYRAASTGEWVIVATTDNCDVWFARGKPFPPYWEYHVDARQWRQRPLSAASEDRPANLFIDYRLENLPRHVSVAYKQPSLTDRNVMEQYRRVVPGIRQYCMATAK